MGVPNRALSTPGLMTETSEAGQLTETMKFAVDTAGLYHAASDS